MSEQEQQELDGEALLNAVFEELKEKLEGVNEASRVYIMGVVVSSWEDKEYSELVQAGVGAVDTLIEAHQQAINELKRVKAEREFETGGEG
jgi:antitoxin component HigA of HigAB toxin-antitoxin module